VLKAYKLQWSGLTIVTAFPATCWMLGLRLR
jgi:hypothetical protein